MLEFLQNRVGNFNKLKGIGSTLKIVERKDRFRTVWYSTFHVCVYAHTHTHGHTHTHTDTHTHTQVFII